MSLLDRFRNFRRRFWGPLYEHIHATRLRATLGEMAHASAHGMRALLQPDAAERVLRAFDAGRTNWARPWALAALGAALAA